MFKLTLKQSTILLTFLVIIIACNEDPTEPNNGVDGINGFNALVNVQDEPAGDNCSSGGVRISVGQDSNENGTLDDSEVSSVSFICNGGAGNNGSDGQNGATLVARTSPENPGNNCESGGTLVEIGADANSNNSLDDSEVQTSFYVCNGDDGTNGDNGTNGLTSLIRVSNSSSCTNGGITIEVGLDDNDNGELDEGEVNASYDLCNGLDGADGSNGTNGLSTLINVKSESSGDNCANGGLLIEVGIDDNSDHVLDSDEVDATSYVCNGADGSDGNDGADGTNGIASITRVTTESGGSNCANGGLKLEIGMDDVTQDGTLQNEEVDYTYYVCNGLDGSDGTNGSDGIDGISTFIRTTTEPAGANCSAGGVKIELGLDANGNQVFDAGEEFGSPVYVCNGQNGTNGSDGADGTDGADGKSVIVTSAPAGGECANGGTTLTFGYDNDSNGTVDVVLETFSVCNGVDGVDGTGLIIRKTAVDPGPNCASGGTFVEIDRDENGNGLFDDGPIEISFYVCNGTDGSDGSNGNNSLIRVSNEPAGANCPNGGLKIESGIDDNGNGVLNVPGEVDATAYVCNGSDGSDGSSANIYEFYFQEGFDGYSGVLDVAISDKQGTEIGETFSVDRKPEGDFHGLIYFPEIDTKIKEVISSEFAIVEAILYLRGRSTRLDGASSDNYIGVKTLTPEAPLFDVSRVSWTAANDVQNWQLPGVTDNSTDADANAYSDMFRLPYHLTFNGYIPLLLNRDEIKLWADSKDNNKGFVLLMADDLSEYEIDIVGSKNTKDISYRPLLYLKVKTDVKGRSTSTADYKSKWKSMSYEQKLAPLKRKRD